MSHRRQVNGVDAFLSTFRDDEKEDKDSFSYENQNRNAEQKVAFRSRAASNSLVVRKTDIGRRTSAYN